MADSLSTLADSYLAENDLPTENGYQYTAYCITGLLRDGNVDVVLNSSSDLSFIRYNDIVEVQFIRLADYNRIQNAQEALGPGEAIVCAVKTQVEDDLSVAGLPIHAVKHIDADSLWTGPAAMCSVTASLIVVVADIDAYAVPLSRYKDYNGTDMLLLRWYYEFDCPAAPEAQQAAGSAITACLTANNTFADRVDSLTVYTSVQQTERHDFYTTFGGLFFIGLLLSTVFLIAAAQIIYYKQLCEGIEDQRRFAIMRSIGMTCREIRRSIDSQMRTVFLLPIGFAIAHLCFAFPFINRLLMLFSLFDLPLLIRITAGSALVCTLLYVAVYRITAGAYYRIVTGSSD